MKRLDTGSPAPSDGQRAHVEALVRAHRPELVAFVRRRAGHLVDPEDVVQQASLQAVRAAASLVDHSRGRAWLFRIVRNALADAMRTLGIPVADASPDENAAPDAPAGDTCRCTLALAKTLKPEYATILERVVVQDTPVTSLAADLGVTPNNAMVRLHRAREALRARLREHCGTTSLRGCIDCGCEERGCCALPAGGG